MRCASWNIKLLRPLTAVSLAASIAAASFNDAFFLNWWRTVLRSWSRLPPCGRFFVVVVEREEVEVEFFLRSSKEQAVTCVDARVSSAVFRVAAILETACARHDVTSAI